MSWPEIKNMVILKCCLLSSYAATMNYFSMGLTCDEKQILLTTGGRPAQWLDWEEAPKHFPKSNLHQKKRSWSLFGGLLPVWSITAFLILAKPLHLRSMLNKSLRFTKNHNAYSQNWPTKWAEFFSTTMHITQPTLQKLNKLSYEVLPHLPYSPDLSPTSFHFFKHLDNFLHAKWFHNQQEAENAFQEFVESWSTDFHATGINQLISCW